MVHVRRYLADDGHSYDQNAQAAFYRRQGFRTAFDLNAGDNYRHAFDRLYKDIHALQPAYDADQLYALARDLNGRIHGLCSDHEDHLYKEAQRLVLILTLGHIQVK